MAVAFDAKATAQTSVTGGTTVSNANLTVGSGSNRALIAVVTWLNTGTPSAPSAHWDTAGTNQAMTQIGSIITGGADDHIALFGLIAPTSGNKNFTLSWTTAVDCIVDLIAFTGVDQTSVAVAFPHVNSATGAASPATVNITSATGNYTVAVFGANATADLTTLNQTQLYGPDATSSPNGSGAANYAIGAASNTHSCTLSATGEWAVLGCDVLASGGGAAVTTVIDPWEQSKPPSRWTPARSAPFLAFTDLAPEDIAKRFHWFEWLSEPVRIKPTKFPAIAPFDAFVPLSKEYIPRFRWYEWLSEPVRVKPALPAAEQQFLALTPPQITSATGAGNMLWYSPWSSVTTMTIMLGEG